MIKQGCRFDTPTQISPAYDYSLDPSYVSFSSRAPVDSWKCLLCTEKHGTKKTKNITDNNNSNTSNNSSGSDNNAQNTNKEGESASASASESGEDEDDVFLAVWNKPNTQTCRFCGVARPFDINQGEKRGRRREGARRGRRREELERIRRKQRGCSRRKECDASFLFFCLFV